MINLKNTCILVRAKEENEMLLKEAEKQGFHWFGRSDCQPLKIQHFPDILKFSNSKDVVYGARIGTEDSIFHEASELLDTKETKEMTAREFVDWVADASDCRGRNCAECILTAANTKCNRSLCVTRNWKGNIDELLEIAVSGRTTALSPEEQAIDTIEKFIENPDRAELNDEFVEALKQAVEKLKKESED